jgi:hypothetical protein
MFSESGFRRAEEPSANHEEMLRRHPELHEGIPWKLERRIRSSRAVFGQEQDANFFRRLNPAVSACRTLSKWAALA